MVSAAILSARGDVPDFMLDLSLLSQLQFTFPLAPAEGLFLVNAGLGPTCNGQVSQSLNSKSLVQYTHSYFSFTANVHVSR